MATEENHLFIDAELDRNTTENEKRKKISAYDVMMNNLIKRKFMKKKNEKNIWKAEPDSIHRREEV